jgi:acetyl esterase
MERQYSSDLLRTLARMSERTIVHGNTVLVKKIPDCDETGAIDPRVYEDNQKMLKMMRFVPRRFLKINMSPKRLIKLRAIFNDVKGIPITITPIKITLETVKAEDGYEIPIRIYTTSTMGKNLPVLYYIHGGGFFAGHPDVIEESVKLFVEKFDLPVVSVDYRWAPEHPFPIGHNDVLTVYKWIIENAASFHGDQYKIFVSGDSSGGNLAQYCSTKAYEDKLILVKGQLLLYATLNMASVEDEYFHWSLDQYEMSKKHKAAIKTSLGMLGNMGTGLNRVLGVEDPHNDYLNPYSRDPKNNPTTFIAVGEHDYLKVENLAYAAKLNDAGIKTKTFVYKGMGHAFFDQCGILPQCEDLAIEMGVFILENS